MVLSLGPNPWISGAPDMAARKKKKKKKKKKFFGSYGRLRILDEAGRVEGELDGLHEADRRVKSSQDRSRVKSFDRGA